LTELAQNVVDAFYREEIGVGHALLLAKLQPDQQEQALTACFKEDWSVGGQKPKRILLPVRSLQFWIESNVLSGMKMDKTARPNRSNDELGLNLPTRLRPQVSGMKIRARCPLGDPG
jgi:hypothetical protein